MNISLAALVILSCYLQINQVQSQYGSCYGGQPVCGINGRTYRNECVARRRGITIACRRRCPCRSDCICTAEYQPVCGGNGQTYSNSCMARCAGTTIACRRRCPCRSDCICTEEYQPVCGENGQTYSNSCKARCAGVRVQCPWRCPCFVIGK